MPRGRGRVGLVVAGVQKAGTTALFETLRALPGFAAPAVKEPHIFDDDSGAVDWADPDYAAAYRRRHFAAADPGAVWFEATPITLFWPPALKRLHRYEPDMRIVVLVRDPIERAFSHWSMEWARGWEGLPFAAAIREGRRRMDALAPLAPERRVWSYVERGLYGAQVERLFRIFPPRQVLLLDAARLAADAAGAVGDVAALVGLPRPSAAEVPNLRANRRADLAYPSRLAPADADLLRGVYRPDLERFAALTGFDAEAWPTLLGGGWSA